MGATEDVMPLPQLPGTVACALLPIDADEGAASWIPVVRAAVRRTQQRLFLLFTGALASRDPCEGLTQLASAALEVAAAEGRPRLCVVPLFPTAGWADLAAGKTPAGRQAATLKDVQVVFAAAAPSPAARASTGEHSATASDAGQSGGSGSSGSGAGGSGRGRVVYHRSSKKGDEFAHSGATEPESGTAAPSGGAAEMVESAHGVGSGDLMAVVALAETLTAAGAGGGSPVAIGTVEPVPPPGNHPDEGQTQGSSERQAWGHVAVGGTFDRLHAGHRILLAATALAALEAAYVGVTGPALLENKKHGELLETYEVRAAAAADYLRLVRPRLAVHTGMLHDAKGMAAEVEAIQALVVSAETAAGAPPINDDRIARGFPPLEVVSVELVGAKGGVANKLSSTALRAAEASASTKKSSSTHPTEW